MPMVSRMVAGTLVVLSGLGPTGAVAQRGVGTAESRKKPIQQRVQEGSTLGEVDVVEHLGERLPLDVTLTNHEGERVRLADFFDGGPVVLTFNYYTCPVLCSLLLEAAAKTLRGVPWTAGDQYEVVTISIDPRDTPERAAKKRRQILDTYGKSNGGWHFLVGDEEAIRETTEAAGIEYTYDESQKQYAHPDVITFVTPEGKLARYLYGLQLETTDARLALFEAADGNTLSAGEQVILSCYAYDPEAGGYAVFGYRVMQVGGVATVIALGGFLGFLWQRERRKRRPVSRRAG